MTCDQLFGGLSSVHPTQVLTDKAHTLLEFSLGQIPAKVCLIPKSHFLMEISTKLSVMGLYTCFVPITSQEKREIR